MTNVGRDAKPQPGKTRNVLILNAATLNGGDAAILTATMAMLKRLLGRDTAFVVHDIDADAASGYHDGIQFRPPLFTHVERLSARRKAQVAISFCLLALAPLRRTAMGRWLTSWLPVGIRSGLDDYKAADLVVSSGGTYLVPHYEVYSKLFNLLLARAMKRPLVLFTQSLGPFPAGRRRPLMRFVLNKADLVLVRDERSRQALEALGIDSGRTKLCADAAFFLAPEDIAKTSPTFEESPRNIAISVRNWPHFRSRPAQEGMEAYLSAMAEFTEYLVLRHGAKVTFISTCQGTPEYWADDGLVAAGIAARLPKQVAEHVVCDRGFHRTAYLLDHLRQQDFVVSTRLHFAILSLCAGTPVLPIAYEFKTSELFERLGLGALTLDIETVTAPKLIEAFEAALPAWRERHDAIWSAVNKERRSAAGAARHVAELVFPPDAGDETPQQSAETSGTLAFRRP